MVRHYLPLDRIRAFLSFWVEIYVYFSIKTYFFFFSFFSFFFLFFYFTCSLFKTFYIKLSILYYSSLKYHLFFLDFFLYFFYFFKHHNHNPLSSFIVRIRKKIKKIKKKIQCKINSVNVNLQGSCNNHIFLHNFT